jgi:hypothetical protein
MLFDIFLMIGIGAATCIGLTLLGIVLGKIEV